MLRGRELLPEESEGVMPSAVQGPQLPVAADFTAFAIARCLRRSPKRRIFSKIYKSRF
jgi:hypothetical protein